MKNDQPPAVPERILDAALEILGESGIQHLTQVKVAQRAGVRQSHLTYYFPTRDDLLEAVTERGVDRIASGLSRAVVDGPDDSCRELLERLNRSVADPAHMRMFIAMIVEADGDPAIRKIMKGATRRMEAAVAQALGDDHPLEYARVILAAMWGLGLYHFLMQPASKQDPAGLFLSWLNEPLTGSRTPDTDARSNK